MGDDKTRQQDHRFILNKVPEKPRYIATDAEDRKYAHVFDTLTNLFNPRDMYDRNILKEANSGRSVLDEHINRLERLIDARGEYVTLVKRILDGEYCSCYNPVTKEIRRKYCLECYGTRIVGGFQLFVNRGREDGKITIASPFNDEEVSWEEWGRDVKSEKEYWTLPYFPLENGHTTFSYDFMICYNEDGTELGRYYITAVKPSRSVGNKITYQKFAARLADRPTFEKDVHTGLTVEKMRGDIIYSIDITQLAKLPGGKP